jgi:FemAB-related protein (PEP-CTERM system-associated)
MIVSELSENTRLEWDAYVNRSVHGLPQHLSAWQEILRETYGYETHFLMTRHVSGPASGAISGIMPLFLVDSILTGRRAMTMPGGICAEDADAARSLAAAAEKIAREHGSTLVQVQDTRQRWLDDYTTVNGHVGWIVDVSGSEEDLSKRLHRNIRRQVRKAGENGLRVQTDRSGELVGDFYRMLSRFTHQAGTPIFSRDFLNNVVRYLAGSFNVVLIYRDNDAIGGYFQLELGDTVYGVWGATLHEFLNLRPVYLAYWTILADACGRGFSYVDMGRSPADSNASNFKKQWGGEPVSIYQQSLGLDGQTTAGMTERTQTDGRLQSFMQIWPKIPYPVATYLGPKLRRHVPFA